ncbi:TPA: hypothetical protein OTY26_001174 [Pseudomonas aeruginosa]|nr:hypothetical protein [Pseudomonas aeruginosa]HBN8419335.1 hypothetical protein [Pseudomonas aeruginosa]HCF6144423.1 hypothetical protein [Pseudomonas aeruginosa]HCT4711609.1 hypothetical protein [Pseudomonas aeruginosa]HCT4757680.1 hypothetical protein [Pseudomonas aeruginosa]
MRTLTKSTRCALCHSVMQAGEEFRWHESRVAIKHRGDYRSIWKPAHAEGSPCIFEQQARWQQQQADAALEATIQSARENGATDDVINLIRKALAA